MGPVSRDSDSPTRFTHVSRKLFDKYCDKFDRKLERCYTRIQEHRLTWLAEYGRVKARLIRIEMALFDEPEPLE